MTTKETEGRPLLMFICTVALTMWHGLWMDGKPTIFPLSDFVGPFSEFGEWNWAFSDISTFLSSRLSMISGQEIALKLGDEFFWGEIGYNLMMLNIRFFLDMLWIQEIIFTMLFFTEIAYVTRPLAIVYLGYELCSFYF